MKNIAIIFMVALCTACASHKGSTSLGSTTHRTSSSKPVIKSNEQIAAEKEAADLAAEKARRQAEAAAQQAAAEAAAQQAAADEAAAKALAEAQAKAKAEEERLAAAAKAREEKVKIVETQSTTNGKYHVIVGSYKSIENARAASETAINQGFTPSIMENDEGLYRVAVFNAATESVARTRLAQIKMKFATYSDAWLLIQK